MAIAPGERLGPYQIVSVLGAGGMGEVYRAHDPRLGRDVAVKLLPSSFAADADRLARFTREAQLLAGLNHPHIAHVYGLEEVAESNAPPALVMELVEGPTLADRIAAGAIPPDEALPIARQIAAALEYAHDAGVIHRDLKPANIKLRPDGAVKVLDFGLAKAFEPARGADAANAANTPTVPANKTEAGVVLGTAAYMAPEQVRGRVVDKRIDIWAFGVVLFEMLTGRQLFAGHSSSDIMASVIRDDPPWDTLPAPTPPHARALLGRCLERDPRQRLRDIGEARVLLDAPGSESERAPQDRAAKTPHRSVMLWRTAAIALGLIAVGAIATLLRPTEGRAPFPVRFTIPQSAAIALYQQTISPAIAVSPDGQLIATAAPEGLFLWSAATGSSRLLEDTAGANAPFFSPDGNHIGFFAGEELRRIPVSGGSASVVAPAQSGAATWGRDDTILYTRWRGEGIGLWQVQLGGGEPRLVVPAATLVDLHAFPAFLPDGRRYLFLKGAYSLPVGKRQICIGDLDGAEPVCVAQGDSNAMYSPSGHLIFVRAGALVALPFDERRLQTTGSIATLARGIRWFGPVGVAAFGVSADGRVLVHTHALAPHRLVWFDRTGNEIGQVGASAMYNILRLSPDGTRIAVDIWNEANGGRDLWWIDVASGDPTRVTFDPLDVYLGAWSPDGRSLLYGRPGPGPPDVTEIPITGGVPRTVLSRPGVQLPQDWSSDRRWIAYIEVLADRDERHLWLLPRDGEPRRVRDTPDYTFDGRFSPDGRLLAYVSNETGRAEVYVTSLDGATQPRRVSRAGGFLPRWRGDGREMYFFQPDGMLMAADLTAGAPSPVALFRVNDVSRADVYSAPREGYAVYDVSRDGQRFLLRAPDREIAQSDELRVWIDWAPR